MAISVKVGTFTERASESSSPVPYPSGLAAGDLLVLMSSTTSAVGENVVPSGWTQQVSLFGMKGGVAAVPYLSIMTKVSDGTETGTITITHANNSVSAWQMLAFSGVNTSVSFSPVTAVLDGTPGKNSIAVASQTTASGQAMVYASALSWTTATATPPSGFTETGDRTTGTRPFSCGYNLTPSTPSSGTITTTFSGIGNPISATLLLSPAGAGVTEVWKRWNGTAWADTATIKRWNGTAWV